MRQGVEKPRANVRALGHRSHPPPSSPVRSRRPHHVAPTRRCIMRFDSQSFFFAKQQAVALSFHEEPVNNNCIGSAEDRARISNIVEKARVSNGARCSSQHSVRASQNPNPNPTTCSCFATTGTHVCIVTLCFFS